MIRIFPWLGLAAWVLLLWPFPATTILATSIACVSYPYFFKLKRMLSRRWAIVIYTTSVFLSVIFPIGLVISLVIPQAVAGVRILDGFRDPGFFQGLDADKFFKEVDAWLQGIPGFESGIKEVFMNISGLIATISKTILTSGFGIAGGVFQTILVFFVFIMIIILCVTNAKLIYRVAHILTGFQQEMLNRFVLTIRNAIWGVLVGIVFVSMIQGFLCGIGFAVAHVPQPAFWGLIAACVAPIPFIGTSLVWLPVCGWLWLTGDTMTMVALLVWCAFVVASVDNLLRPFLLRTGIDASITALILSILCGLAAFGPIGIFVGPVLVAIAIQVSKECTYTFFIKEVHELDKDKYSG